MLSTLIALGIHTFVLLTNFCFDLVEAGAVVAGDVLRVSVSNAIDCGISWTKSCSSGSSMKVTSWA